MQLKCPFCGHVWTPRSSQPAECPRCKRYFFYDDPNRQPIKLPESSPAFCAACGSPTDEPRVTPEGALLCESCYEKFTTAKVAV